MNGTNQNDYSSLQPRYPAQPSMNVPRPRAPILNSKEKKFFFLNFYSLGFLLDNFQQQSSSNNTNDIVHQFVVGNSSSSSSSTTTTTTPTVNTNNSSTGDQCMSFI